jgi:multidrug efflux pump subunit AcrB
LRPHDPSTSLGAGRAHEEEESTRFAGWYARIMTPLMDRPSRRLGLYGVVVFALFGSMALLFVKAVKVKMLPFDNKSEFQVVLDLPEGTTLETTNALGREVAAYLRHVPEVVSTQEPPHPSTSTGSSGTTSCAADLTWPTCR